MKFKFKIQKYQTDAVEATADVFAGQPNLTAKYTRDLGRRRDRQKTFDDKMGIKHIVPCLARAYNELATAWSDILA